MKVCDFEKTFNPREIWGVEQEISLLYDERKLIKEKSQAMAPITITNNHFRENLHYSFEIVYIFIRFNVFLNAFVYT